MWWHIMAFSFQVKRKMLSTKMVSANKCDTEKCVTTLVLDAMWYCDIVKFDRKHIDSNYFINQFFYCLLVWQSKTSVLHLFCKLHFTLHGLVFAIYVWFIVAYILNLSSDVSDYCDSMVHCYVACVVTINKNKTNA